MKRDAHPGAVLPDGASIADISALAGVSPGHIYYYFRNKEEIITAIAAAELEALLDIHDGVHAEQSVVEAIVAHSGDIALHYANPQNSRLRLEILAESARNPSVSTRVQTLDRRARKRLPEPSPGQRGAVGRRARSADCRPVRTHQRDPVRYDRARRARHRSGS